MPIVFETQANLLLPPTSGGGTDQVQTDAGSDVQTDAGVDVETSS